MDVYHRRKSGFSRWRHWVQQDVPGVNPNQSGVVQVEGSVQDALSQRHNVTLVNDSRTADRPANCTDEGNGRESSLDRWRATDHKLFRFLIRDDEGGCGC